MFGSKDKCCSFATPTARPDITNMSRTILTAYLRDGTGLAESDYLPASGTRETYALFQGALPPKH